MVEALKETFISGRSMQTTEEEEEAISKFFMMLGVYVNILAKITGGDTIDFALIASMSGIDGGLESETLDFLKEQDLIDD